MRKSVCLIFALLITGCFNYTGENHKHAEQEAKTYVKKLAAAGIDVKFIECMQHDTDADGYLACTIAVDGTPQTIDCAGKDLVQSNHGCKAYVAKLRVTNVNTGSDSTNSTKTRR
jgi:hypothetical protein